MQIPSARGVVEMVIIDWLFGPTTEQSRISSSKEVNVYVIQWGDASTLLNGNIPNVGEGWAWGIWVDLPELELVDQPAWAYGFIVND